jgi:alpha-D-xyloside xylohydrolase
MQMHRQVARQLQYPWRFGQAALANFQFFARLHVLLFPYIYTYAKIASTTGLPIIRPLVLLDQTDPNTFTVNHTYRFGNELLVAPMLTPNATARNLYLPHGDWIDFWNHSSHPGGQTFTWTNPDQSKLPLFVRAGAIIPMLPSDVRTLCDANYVNDPTVKTRGDDLLFQVYPAGASSFTVFDGTEAQCQGDAAGGTVTVTATARNIVLRILANAPDAVRLDGEPLAQALAPGTPGWRFDATTGFLEINFSHPGGVTTIEY